MTKRLLIIPARSGSRRIKNKNFRNFCGKPIIFHSLNTVKKSKLFDKIHVSTDSKKFKQILNRYGYDLDFLRPKSLSKDKVPLVDVMKFVYKKYYNLGFRFDEIWNMSACSPLTIEKDLKKATLLLKKHNSKVVISVTDFAAPLEWAFKLNKNNLLKSIYNTSYLTKNSQLLEKKYHDSSAFFGLTSKNLNKKNFNIYKNFVGYFISRKRSIDIDEQVDWDIAEAIYKNLKKKKDQ